MPESLHSVWLKRLAGKILPAPCLGCGVELSGSLRLCEGCLGHLQAIRVACAECGTPLPSPGSCLTCIARPPRYTRRAVWRYGDIGRALMGAFKRRALYPIAAPLAAAALQALQAASPGEEFLRADLATCVPGHWLRRLARGYNPAALLAAPLARELALPFHAHLLRRRTAGRQTGRSGAARRRIGRAFSPGRSAALVRGRTVLLIDDVETTGATLRAAALELKRLGAREVRALTFFRVVERNN